MRKNTDPEKLVAKIIKAYEKNIAYLPNYQKGHFFTRAYKVTGEKGYVAILVDFALMFCLRDFAVAGEGIKRKKYKYKQEIALGKIKNQRARNRIILYRKYPKLKAYLDFLHYFIYINKFHLRREILKRGHKNTAKLLKKENFSKIFLSKEKIKADGSYIFNCAYLLKDLKICDITEEAIGILKEIYFENNGKLKKKLGKNNFVSLIYALTHIIIAESEYYEKPAQKNHWILDIFLNNTRRIKKLPIDALAEVGLCFKLCRKEKQYKKEFDIIKEEVLRRYSLHNLRTKSAIIRKEHTNSMVMLLFSSRSNFYKGPSLKEALKRLESARIKNLKNS